MPRKTLQDRRGKRLPLRNVRVYCSSKRSRDMFQYENTFNQHRDSQEEEQQLARAARIERYRQRGRSHRRQLAEEIDDNAMLISSIRFYLSHLRTNRAVAAVPIRAREKSRSKHFRKHLKAARRVLGVRYIKADLPYQKDAMRLSRGYHLRLEEIGLDSWHDADWVRLFEGLNAYLVIDEDVEYFSKRHQILSNVKHFLVGERRRRLQLSASPNIPTDPMSAVIQNRIRMAVKY